jgi:hypothetical protein
VESAETGLTRSGGKSELEDKNHLCHKDLPYMKNIISLILWLSLVVGFNYTQTILIASGIDRFG